MTGLLSASVTIGSGISRFSLFVRCSRTTRDPVKLRFGLAGICARLCQRDAKLIEFDFARQLPIHTNDDAVRGFEVLNFPVGVARLLSQFSYPLLQPEAGAVGRLELRLELILDISIRKCIGDLRRFIRVKRGERNLLDVATSEPRDLQIAPYIFNGFA